VLFKVNGEIQSGTWANNTFQTQWTIEAVDNFLRNKYPQYKGLNYSAPSVSSPKNDITELPPPPETPTNIAVVDFNGNNISDGEVRALTDRLRAELFKTKHFNVIEREMMQEVLKEQGFQQSGCTTDECMVQIGRLIGVQKIIGGSISKVGNIYSVSSRIVNVETGEIEKSEVYDHIGEIGQLLTNGMREVAIGLVK
jgi:curli biogenesis system outer membrane secretion channel CsgG